MQNCIPVAHLRPRFMLQTSDRKLQRGHKGVESDILNTLSHMRPLCFLTLPQLLRKQVGIVGRVSWKARLGQSASTSLPHGQVVYYKSRKPARSRQMENPALDFEGGLHSAQTRAVLIRT